MVKGILKDDSFSFTCKQGTSYLKLRFKKQTYQYATIDRMCAKFF